MPEILRKCDNCNEEYYADNRNLKRGWGLCCSKSCAAEKREKSKPGYNLKIKEASETKKLVLICQKKESDILAKQNLSYSQGFLTYKCLEEYHLLKVLENPNLIICNGCNFIKDYCICNK